MKNVVLIDDNSIVIESLCQSIDWAKLGFRIAATFNDGMEGLQYILEQPVDLVILDINLPTITGIEILKAIKQYQKPITCIAITGYDYFNYAREALLFGAVDIILKPIDDRILYSIIEEKVLNQNSESIGKTTDRQKNKYEQNASRLCISSPQAEYHNETVSKVISYLEESIDKRHSLDELCSHFSISKSHLCRIIRKESGKSFTEIYTELRMKKATELLRTGKYRINEVAEMVGIDNYAYFYQVFKKATGQKPSDYVVDEHKNFQ